MLQVGQEYEFKMLTFDDGLTEVRFWGTVAEINWPLVRLQFDGEVINLTSHFFLSATPHQRGAERADEGAPRVEDFEQPRRGD